MTITVLDTDTAMHEILRAAPADRPELLRRAVEPAAGMYRYFPGAVDLVAMHAMGSGFPLDRDEEACLEALATLREADVWTRIETALGDGIRTQLAATPDITVPDLTVLFLLGDPSDDYFMGAGRGVIGNGAVTGYLAITVWPTAEVLEQLEAIAVHELHHNLRFAPGGVVWDPAVVTVGDHVVSEGLADAFARQLHGDEIGRSLMGRATRDDDAVFEKVLTGLDVTGMQNFAAWVHGDEAATRFGATPVGLPAGAGYSAGNRLADAYLTATGQTADQVLHVPAREVIDVALGRT
ncbi:MAG: peptidase [Actinomycetales bacterium]|nr:peptidase [Actinomycetales bacterium]